MLVLVPGSTSLRSHSSGWSHSYFDNLCVATACFCSPLKPLKSCQEQRPDRPAQPLPPGRRSPGVRTRAAGRAAHCQRRKSPEVDPAETEELTRANLGCNCFSRTAPISSFSPQHKDRKKRSARVQDATKQNGRQRNTSPKGEFKCWATGSQGDPPERLGLCLAMGYPAVIDCHNAHEFRAQIAPPGSCGR